MKTLNVLVIDTQGQLSAEYLHSYSPHKFQMAANAEEAIGRLQATDWDMVLTDGKMNEDDALLLRSMVIRQQQGATLSENVGMSERKLMRLANDEARRRSHTSRRLRLSDNPFELSGMRTA